MLKQAFRGIPTRLAVATAFCLVISGAAAQLNNFGLNSQVQRALQSEAGQDDVRTISPSVEIYQPIIPESRPEAPKSRLEDIYTQRAGRPLVQFGYDILGVPTPVSSSQIGAVQENYVLGVGDEVILVLRGQEESTTRQRINRDGQIIIPRLNPIQASGRTLAALRRDIEGQVSQTYISSMAFVSLGEIRQISVLLTGEVRAPGTRILSALATPLDALLISGGIAKTGSLRNVAIIRGNQTTTVDLYALLTRGDYSEVGTLQNGDRIYVPPLQNTVAIAGMVRRPGIYEMKAGAPASDAAALIELAGGYEIAGAYRLSKMQLERDGSLRLVSLPQTGMIANGEVLLVDTGNDAPLERVRIAGAVRLPGVHPRTTASSINRLIRGLDDISPEAYTAFAVVARRDPRINTRVLVPFSVTQSLAGTKDVPLQNDDVVYVFNRDEIRALSEAAAAVTAPAGATASNNFSAFANAGGALSTEELATSVRGPSLNTSAQPNAGNNAPANGAAPFNPAQGGNIGPQGFNFQLPQQGAFGQANRAQIPQVVNPPPMNMEGEKEEPVDILTNLRLRPDYRKAVRDTAEALRVTVDVLVRFAGDHLVWVTDQVRDPGAYLTSGDTTLDEVIQIAGGVLESADLSFVEVTSTSINPVMGASQTMRTGYKGTMDDFRRVSLRPLDVIRIRPIFTDRNQGQVRIAGEVRFPGNFDITRGERLSTVLERAGGLTDQAYAYGAIFTRQRAALSEQEANLRQARQMEAQIASFLVTATPDQANNSSLLLALAQQLRDTPVLGRVAVTADPAVLRVKPEFDILLEPGDRLVIPKRPSTVTVSGEVLNSGSFQYETGLTVDDYVGRAGGTTADSDRSRMFIVMPDGSARTIAENWLTYSNTTIIPPGATIVVPRDLRPLDLNQFLKDATQIASQLAITAASSIVVINR